MTFLRSFWKRPIDPAIKAVIAPKIAMNVKLAKEYSIMDEVLKSKKTPAVTIVAAWIRAETGVGPSIASGSQVWRPIWADLATAPMKKKKEINSIMETFKKPKGTYTELKKK